MDHFPRYDEIYNIFNIGDFPPEDNNLEVYHNIKKSCIHLIVAHPMLFPYNDATIWCLAHLDKDTTTILRITKLQIASLRPEDIRL
jgi:hypothetical protein